MDFVTLTMVEIRINLVSSYYFTKTFSTFYKDSISGDHDLEKKMLILDLNDLSVSLF